MISIYYEFDMNMNPFRARQIFIKAIKMNPTSSELWVEYFRFECKFIKLIEKRENVLAPEDAVQTQKTVDEDPMADDGGFLAFEDDTPGNTNFRDLLEDSDEEMDAQQKIDLEKKSNHTLLLVIFESIQDNFKGKSDVQTYRRLLRVLREEKGDSAELRLAHSKITEQMLKDDEVSRKDKVILSLESKGVYQEWDFFDEKQAEKFTKKIVKSLESEEDKGLALEALALCSKKTIEFINSNQDILKELNHIIKGGVTLESLIRVLNTFDVKISEESKEAIESIKYDENILDLYLRKVLKKESNYQKVKYLEEFTKKMNESPKISISAVQKVEIVKKVITTIVDYLKEKDFTEEDEVSKYKYIAQYLKVLISMTKLNVEILNHLAEVLIERWVGPNGSDGRLVNTIGDTFWPLKKQCPARIYIYLLQHSSTYNKMAHFDLALQCHPESLELWKLRLELARSSNDLPELNNIYERGLNVFKTTEERNQLYSLYQKVLS